MAYQIKRNHVVEELQIEDEGQTLTIKVDLNVDDVIGRYNAAGRELVEAEQKLRNAKTEDMESTMVTLGEAVTTLFRVVFGDDQAAQIIDFYNGRYMEMLADIAPFLNDVVAPRMVEGQERAAERYKNMIPKKGLSRFIR